MLLAPIVILLLLLLFGAVCYNVRMGIGRPTAVREPKTLIHGQSKQQQKQLIISILPRSKQTMTTTTMHAKKMSQTEDDGYSLSHKLQNLRLFLSRFMYKTPGQLILVRHGTLVYTTVHHIMYASM